MPTMPALLRTKFSELSIDSAKVEALLEEPTIAHELENIIDAHDINTAKMIANWYSGEIARLVGEEEITWDQVIGASARLIDLVAMIDGGLLSTTAAKDILKDLISSEKSAKEIAEEKDLMQVSDSGELEMIIMQVISENQKAANDIKAGEMKAIGFLVGQVMKASGGKANPGVVQDLLRQSLGL